MEMDGKAIVERWRLDHWPHLRGDQIVGTAALARRIDSALAAARAEEREWAATICENTRRCENDTDYNHVGDGHYGLAAAIRARGTP